MPTLDNSERELFTKWNRRLKAEGLGVLDRRVYNTDGEAITEYVVTVNNKGSGKITTSERGLNRAVALSDISAREALYWNTKFKSPRERAIIKRWSQGLSTRDIATELKIGRKIVRLVITRVEKRAKAAPCNLKLILEQCDPDFVNEVLDTIDIRSPNPEDLPQHLHELLETPLSAYEQHMITNEDE